MQIPGYKIKALIGQGGMAKVYLALQESLQREVALKVMDESLSADPQFRDRFLKEGRIIAQLSSHPDIVTIYDIGYAESHYYMAMEYLVGNNLKQRIKKQVELDQPMSIVRQIASALGYAHAKGFVHRDVKPANILFHEDGAAMLTDFGIAKAMSSETQLTKVGFTVGTPDYMSPEQAMGLGVDARSDLYSLGVVLFEILTGDKPFKAQDAFSMAYMHVNNPVPQLPEERNCYQPLIDGLLAKEPQDRFQSAEQLLSSVAEIEQIAKGRGDATHFVQATRSSRLTQPMSSDVSNKRKEVPVRKFSTWKAAMLITGILAVFSGGLYVMLGEWGIVPGGATDCAQQERADRLLQAAEVHVMVGRLYAPIGSNACEAYTDALKLCPDAEKAREGLRHIKEIGGKSCSP